MAPSTPVTDLRRAIRRRSARANEARRARSIRDLRGFFRVETVSGGLPIFGLSRWFDEPGHGWIMVSGIRVLPFRVAFARGRGGGLELRYPFLPLRDELVLDRGGWYGRGFLFGREIYRFRLVGLTKARFETVW